jgi:hypothetical protein
MALEVLVDDLKGGELFVYENKEYEYLCLGVGMPYGWIGRDIVLPLGSQIKVTLIAL